MMVSDVPHETLKVGDRVISAVGTPGVIAEIGFIRGNDPAVGFCWFKDDGPRYYPDGLYFHHQMDSVVYIEGLYT